MALNSFIRYPAGEDIVANTAVMQGLNSSGSVAIYTAMAASGSRMVAIGISPDAVSSGNLASVQVQGFRPYLSTDNVAFSGNPKVGTPVYVSSSGSFPTATIPISGHVQQKIGTVWQQNSLNGILVNPSLVSTNGFTSGAVV